MRFTPLSVGVAALAVLAPETAATAPDGLRGQLDLATAHCSPSTPGNGYQASLDSYYSLDVREIKPVCVFRPRTAQHVSRAIKVLSKSTAGNVAVRGGGHSIWPNNNVADGVTIDLSLLNQTEVHLPNKKNAGAIASVGAGSRWTSALLEVEKYGLSITAGRVGTVGVAGLTLGGGLSFHSGRHGFTCDDVTNYEVVLANGQIVDANSKQNPDLFKALKGGGGNFGIVTRFDFAAFPAGPLYGGMVTAAWDHRDTIVDSFIRLIDINEQNPTDSQIVLYMYDVASRSSTVSSTVINTDGITNSTSFKPMAAVPWLSDQRATQTYGELAAAMSDNGGDRHVWFSLCFQNNKRVVDKATELYNQLIDDTQGAMGDVDRIIFVFQQLPRHYAQKNAGGNVLGMDKSLTADSIVWLGEAFARTPEAESLFQRKIAALTDELEAFAEAIGAATQWRYINYVNPTQEPLKSYGAEVKYTAQNIAFMKRVSAKYDPQGFFQTRVPGGFKISHVK
ncbi:Bifunctional solanapyrone synthase [Apiospora hydei]|uniref:Bifunctional solanapyrone synthase n=1 Tax=Apiospora hydei TaxID=1337664 RepID=A0ABR1X4V7_9PEZI